ncbi:MAG: penicillin acylase family protein, partial [Lutibacter sp.]
DGINYYLLKHPNVKPKLITHFEPWMPMYFSEGSIGGDIERVSIKKIKNFYENKSSFNLKEEQKTEPFNFDEPKGSNGIAISGKLSKSGNTMLLINPHTSFYFRPEVHMISEEGLNAYGAVTWGQFFVYQGFNDFNGWMHTSTYTDVIDEYKETLKQSNGKLYYKFGKKWFHVKKNKIVLKYKEGNRLLKKSFTAYHTIHGPVTSKIGNQWVATSLMWNPVKALHQSFIRTKQKSYKGFRKMMDLRTNSSNNTVYADSDGNIAYFHGNFIPKRNPKYDYRKPLDGSNPETKWNGLHTVDESIHLLNPKNGWIQNCNSTPFTAADKFSPKVKDYPKYMSLNRENFRGIHAQQLLKNVNNFTLKDLIKLAYDPYLPAFKELIPGLINAFENHQKEYIALKEPISILKNWNFQTSKSSIAMTLAHFYGINYSLAGYSPKGVNGIDRIKYFGNMSSEVERLKIFKEVITKLNNDFGTWKIEWGSVNRYQRINGNIKQPFNDTLPSLVVGMASGRWGALAAFGARYNNHSKKIYGTRGNSFVAVVEFGDKIKAYSLLAGGNSGDPKSKHFSDQAQDYVDGIFKPVWFYKKDIENHAEFIYKPGLK